jgi:hypothetical protein
MPPVKNYRFDITPDVIAKALIAGGVSFAAYFLLFFDPSVSVPSQTILGVSVGGGRVNNIGLMQQKQNGLIASIAVAIAGGGMLLYQNQKK